MPDDVPSTAGVAIQLARLQGEITGRLDATRQQLEELLQRAQRMDARLEDLATLPARVQALEENRTTSRLWAMQLITWGISLASLGVATFAVLHR